MHTKLIVLGIAAISLYSQSILLFRSILLFAAVVDTVALSLFWAWLFH